MVVGHVSVLVIALGLFTEPISAQQPRDTPKPREQQSVALRLLAHVGGSETSSSLHLDGIYAGALQEDGGFVVGNSATGELRYFSATGHFLRSTGRLGFRPGEFEGIGWMRRMRGDSLVVYDPRASRYSIVDSGGRLGRTFSAGSGSGGVPIGLTNNDGVLMAIEDGLDPHIATGLVRDSLTLVEISLSGSPARQVGRFEAAEWIVYSKGGAGAVKLELGRRALITVMSNVIVHAHSHSNRLTLTNADGKKSGEIILTGVTGRILESGEIDAFLKGYEGDGAALSALRDYYKFAGSLKAPIVSAIHADGSGRLWVALAPAHPADDAMWMVLSERGVPIGTATLPKGSRVLDSRGDKVLSHSVDVFGTEHVNVYKVSR